MHWVAEEGKIGLWKLPPWRRLTPEKLFIAQATFRLQWTGTVEILLCVWLLHKPYAFMPRKTGHRWFGEVKVRFLFTLASQPTVRARRSSDVFPVLNVF